MTCWAPLIAGRLGSAPAVLQLCVSALSLVVVHGCDGHPLASIFPQHTVLWGCDFRKVMGRPSFIPFAVNLNTKTQS